MPNKHSLLINFTTERVTVSYQADKCEAVITPIINQKDFGGKVTPCKEVFLPSLLLLVNKKKIKKSSLRKVSYILH